MINEQYNYAAAQNEGIEPIDTKPPSNRKHLYLKLGLIVFVFSLIGLGLFAYTKYESEDNGNTSSSEIIIWLEDSGLSEGRLTTEEFQAHEDQFKLEYEDTKTFLNEKLSKHPDVESFKFIDKAETYTNFKTSYRDSPEILELVTEDSMPEGFAVSLRDSTNMEEFTTEFENIKLVREISYDQGTKDVSETEQSANSNQNDDTIYEAVIWLDTFRPSSDATVEEIENEKEQFEQAYNETINLIEEKLSNHPEVDSYSFEDKVQQYNEYIDYYRNSPEIVELIDPEKMPESFHVTLTDSAKIEDFTTEFKNINLVQGVTSAPIQEDSPTSNKGLRDLFK